MMIDANKVSFLFLAIIGSIFLGGLYYRLIKKKNNKLMTLLPDIAISAGILGTFVGIFLGLLKFDVNDINGSIPTLLAGLKTAFITSIAGMFTSMFLRIVFESKALNDDTEVQQENPIELLKCIVSGINGLEKSSREIETSIVSCFRSDEEYSLISQLKLIRQEVSDTRKEVGQSLNEFADKIAQSSTDALVEALEKVIGDFNTLLNELVSESFKDLSSAMIKLTEWQENYKTHVDEMQDKTGALIDHMAQNAKVLNDTSGSIQKIDQNLENIDSSISGLSVSAEDISSHIENLKLQNDALNEGIIAIKQIGEEAKSVMPAISEQIQQMTTKLEATVLNVSEQFESSSSLVSDFVQKNMKDMESASEIQRDSIQKSIENIETGLEEELSRALSLLTGSLASLSSKFVSDYQPLTDRLREIVRLPEQIDA